MNATFVGFCAGGRVTNNRNLAPVGTECRLCSRQRVLRLWDQKPPHNLKLFAV
jgi:predicted transcriptional regulator